tara:strand:+ start:21760 stop:22446 length:687 start_codon:yes stop_codon:yes gene_type:complete
MKYFFSIILIGFNVFHAQSDPNPLRFKDSLYNDQTNINNFINYDAKNSIPTNPIVFVGSSSIRMWKTAEYFSDLPVINRGFGGAHLSDVNHFINETVIKYKPRIIVLYAGDNDIAAGKSPEKVFNDFLLFVKLVNSSIYQSKIIFIPIKPSLLRMKFWTKIKIANEMIQNFSYNNPNIFYIDLAKPMFTLNGDLKTSMFADDGLHLSKIGYDLWSSMLHPMLIEVYNK